MSKHPITRLFEQLSTERGFGWYVPDATWRAMLRELYPVSWVSAHHRKDFPPSLLNDQARRWMAFKGVIREMGSGAQ